MPVDTDMAVNSSALEVRACAKTHLMASTILLDWMGKSHSRMLLLVHAKECMPLGTQAL